MEGLPTTEMNKKIIDGLVSKDRNEIYDEPYLIKPIEQPIEWHDRDPYPFGTPSRLPSVTCIGRFVSGRRTRDGDSSFFSGLIVIWFQDEFALPIADSIIEELQKIDWQARAADIQH